MRINRINRPTRPNDHDGLKRQKRPYRKTKAILKERESEMFHVTDMTNPLNDPRIFTYSDVNRNFGAIGMIKHQIDQVISNYGLDLTYFRKKNTFFQDDENNNANMIYGEDTTAQFYVSGAIRAFVSIDNMAWNFNQLGLEAAEQITIYMMIERFEQVFANKIGKIEKRHFEVPVSGDLVHCEVTGTIHSPEFDAFVYSPIDDSLTVKDARISIVDKNVASQFYLARSYNTTVYDLSGVLKGKLRNDSESPFGVYGLLEGDISYHSLNNMENSETWNLAPQVGDYFVMNLPTGISEEWEISQIYDKNLTKSGLNPLLGKYVYQISAVRRVSSHEENTEELDYREPGEDLNEIFGDISKPVKNEFAQQYKEKLGKNVFNEKTNRLGKNAYDYVDGSDQIYGGVQTKPKSK